MEEKWMPIFGYEGRYEISNFGRIKTIERTVRYSCPHSKSKTRKIKTKILNPPPNNRGYVQIILYDKDLMARNRTIHRMVMEHFEPCEDKTMTVNHIDGNKLNNRLDNLEWCTQLENTRHSIDVLGEDRIGVNNGRAKLREQDVYDIRSMLKLGIMKKTMANIYGVTSTCIRDIGVRKNWSHLK